jgi:threonine/homoserine/homoserine lactone efflux protein
MLVGASKFIFQEEDDGKPPPAWLKKIEQFTPREAFSTGIGWLMISPKQWVFVLTAVAVIFTANLTMAASLANYFVFTLLVQTVYFLILIISLTMPERSAKILDTLFLWLKSHFRSVVIVMFSLFGLFFLIKGLTGLVG